MEEITIRKELRPLTIDPEFRDIIPPLMDEERRMLEDSIVANGCETPLTVWNNTIVDGHNRYDICQEHGIPFAIMEKEFENRDEALMWMISTQLGRRNLTTYQKGVLALKFEPLLREQAKEGKPHPRAVTTLGLCRILHKLGKVKKHAKSSPKPPTKRQSEREFVHGLAG